MRDIATADYVSHMQIMNVANSKNPLQNRLYITRYHYVASGKIWPRMRPATPDTYWSEGPQS